MIKTHNRLIMKQRKLNSQGLGVLRSPDKKSNDYIIILPIINITQYHVISNIIAYIQLYYIYQLMIGYSRQINIHFIISSLITAIIYLLSSIYLPKYSNQHMLLPYITQSSQPNQLLLNMSSSNLPPSSINYLLPLINFDGMHFWYNEYQYQPNIAFVFGYTSFVKVSNIILNYIGSLLPLDPLTLLVIQILTLSIINRVFFYYAIKQLVKIIELYEFPDEIIEIVIKLVLYNPSTIFYWSIYSESLYIFMSWKAIRLYLSIKGINNKFLCIQNLKYLILFSVSSVTRSTAIFLSPILGIRILKQLYQILTQYITLPHRNYLSYCRLFMRTITKISQGSVVLLFFLLPFVIYNLWCGYQFGQSNDKISGLNSYGYVQHKYWDVGFLSYYKLNNTIFMIIPLPIIILVIRSLFFSIGHIRKYTDDYLGLQVSFIILIIITLLYTNLQSSTRFFTTHPYFYLCISLYFHGKGQNLCEKIRKMVIRWIWIIYFIIGTVLFTVGFPWT